MKPTKNWQFCYDCGKNKILFETEQKANNFIKFNANEILEETGIAPTRSYYCIACGGYHVTHKNDALNIKSKSEVVIEKYEYELHKKNVKIQVNITNKYNLVKEEQKKLKELLYEIFSDIEIAKKMIQNKNKKIEEIKVKLEKCKKLSQFKGSFKIIIELEKYIFNNLESIELKTKD